MAQVTQQLLSICIPTFNRAEILTECLEDLILKVGTYNFEIIVSDNNSTDNTKEIVEAFKVKYSPLKYIKQNSSSDPDRNFASALSHSTSSYTWLIGDSYRIKENALEVLLELMSTNRFDLIVVNCFNQVKGIDSAVYTNSSKLLDDLGWYLPIMSAYIYKDNILRNADYERYYSSYFLQMGITFEFLEKNKFEVYWYADNGFGATSIPKKSWQYETFNVFAKNWTEFILSLPKSIELPIKLACIKSHGSNYGIFSIKSLLLLREKGWLNYDIFNRYKLYFNYVTTPPLTLVLLIAVCPKSLISFFWSLKKLLFRGS